MKPGRCLAEQVGVKAPGTANSDGAAGEEVGGADLVGAVGCDLHEGGAGQGVADGDRHGVSLRIAAAAGRRCAAQVGRIDGDFKHGVSPRGAYVA